MPLVWGITRIVSHKQERAAYDKHALLYDEFMTAYAALRRACPNGDLRIHLSVEGTREEVGADEPTT
jgi:hypothetical protein